MWYPEDKKELERDLNDYLKSDLKVNKKIHGLIVPHAGYEFSGKIAGKAFSLLKNLKSKPEKAVIIGPSHYVYLKDAVTSNTEFKTPLGKMKLFNTGFEEANIIQEHSIANQIPFLQKLGMKEVMALMIGEISNEKAKEIADELFKINSLYVFSSDLSHFLPYEKAKIIDKQTIKIIENLDFNDFNKLDACGVNGLLVLFYLCKLLNTKPKLIEYKNSGDIIGDKSGVVGYASFWF